VLKEHIPSLLVSKRNTIKYSEWKIAICAYIYTYMSHVYTCLTYIFTSGVLYKHANGEQASLASI